jgi:glucose-1-phosphate thymidylyltransferase
MKCIILCAGYATRLYPLTKDKAKALLPVKGKPILDHIVENVPDHINEIFVVSNETFFNDFVEWSLKYKNRVKVISDGTSSNETRLGGVGDLWHVIKKESIHDDILVILGDNLFNFNLSEFVDFFKKVNNTLVGVYDIKSLEDAKRFGVIKVEENKVISFIEKPFVPKSTLTSTGVYIYPAREIETIKEYMKTDNPKDGPGNLIKHFLDLNKDVYTFTLPGFWYDIGDKKTYDELNS